MSEREAADLPYRHVAEVLREQIETEALGPGDPLPSNREIMAEFSVSSHTAQRAVRALRDAGLIETAQSRRARVRRRPQTVERSAAYTKPPAQGELTPYKARSRIIELDTVSAPAYIAERLDVETGRAVFLRRRVMVRSGAPIELVSSFYPLEIALGTELAEDAGLRGGSPAALARLGLTPIRSREWVFARMPLQWELGELRMLTGVPVLRLLRTVFAEGDRPVEVIEMIMSGDGNVLQYDL
jgi:GntR family transcriptional regulator